MESSSSSEQEPQIIVRNCEKCGYAEQYIHTHDRGSHATWSPLSSDKRIYLECPQCKRILEVENDSLLKTEDRSENSEFISPTLRYLSYLGILCIGLLLGWGFFSLFRDDQSLEKYLKNPKGNVLFISEQLDRSYKVGIIDEVKDNVIIYRYYNRPFSHFEGALELVSNIQNEPEVQKDFPKNLGVSEKIPKNHLNELHLKRIFSLSP